MVPLSSTCSSETSPSARVTTRTPAKTACLWKAATRSRSREKRSRLSAQGDVERAGAHRGEQRLIAGAQRGRARHGGVGEHLDHRPALALRAGAADPDLVLDRRFA